MDFGSILKSLKEGYFVRRKAWPEDHKLTTYSISRLHAQGPDFFILSTAESDAPYHLTPTDVLSEDWEVLPLT